MSSLNSNNKTRQALKRGVFTEVPESEAEYEFMSPNQFFNNNINLTPMINAVQPQRIFYQEKFLSQSLPIHNGEAPLVQTLKDPNTGETFEQYAGRHYLGAVYADADDDGATITSVTPDAITYKTKNGETKTKELYNNFAMNRKTAIHSTPSVKKGDVIKKDQLLARSNYTDDKGVYNMGLNARIAVVPYKGWSYEDGVVISENFAKKLASEHMYSFTQNLTSQEEKKQTTTGKDHFRSLFPKKYDNEQLKNIDDNGVIKVGSTVHQGDPLILASKPRMISSKDSELGLLSKYLKRSRSDASLTWEHEAPGVVTDVVPTKYGWKVNVSSVQPARPGDKISVGRSGSKGTITKIIPQNLVPRTQDGEPVDVLFNPLGVPSRVNDALLFSMMLGKIAKKTGKTIKIPTFNKTSDSWYDYVKDLMEKNGVTDTEILYDPEKDKFLDQPVTIGNDYIIKLHHTAESKFSARGTGAYDANEQPVKGGDEYAQAKRLGGLEINSLLSANAYEFIKDAIQLRGQRNDEYWQAVRRGETPTLAKSSPFVWDKYLALLQGAGMNVIDKSNGKIQLSPFTDKQFNKLDPIELDNPNIVNIKTMKPVQGGLFDPANTMTNKWTKITLDQPYPNPGFEDAIATLLNVRKKDLYDIMDGKQSLGKYGKGNKAIYEALKDVNMPDMFKAAVNTFKSGPKSKRQKALNTMKYIRGLNKNEMTPDELMITQVPVLPAKFRPYSYMGDTFIPGDVNELYKDVFQMRDSQIQLANALGKDAAMQNSTNMYNSIKALYGFGTTMNKKLKQRGVSGFMDKLVGGTSKFSFLNRNVNSKTVDFTGRSVVDVDPTLGMDEVGLPKKMAFKIFAPYIQQALVKSGTSLPDAVKHIKEEDPIALNALLGVLKERAIVYSRAPAWHSHNLMGGWVRLYEGNNIYVSPLVTAGSAMDFDGDANQNVVFVAIKD